MKLAVVIPTYNRRDSLRATLDGLARQTYPMDAFEVIVVSDGSTDGTLQLLAEYAQSSPYELRPFEQPNSGPSAARNRGIREARHEVIIFLDDDVEPVPDFLARHAFHHQDDEKIVVLGPMSPDPARRTQEPVWIAWEHAKLQQTYDLFRPGGAYYEQGPNALHFYSGNASVRRCWLEAVGGFDENFKRQEDVELASRMAIECDVHFTWDFHADGLHRPTRTFAAWLNIPQAYGDLDAHRTQLGTFSKSVVEYNTLHRHFITRQLIHICLKNYDSGQVIIRNCCVIVRICQRFRLTKLAMAILSVLYNVSYSLAFDKRYRNRMPIRQNQYTNMIYSRASDVTMAYPKSDVQPRELHLSVSALICTRGRGDSLVPTVKSILQSKNITAELLILDQSDDDRTEDALKSFRTDDRLRYVRLKTRGKGTALNHGLREAKGDIVAITDDDCEVHPEWPLHHVTIMELYPRVAVTYGNVLATKHDDKAGFIPDYTVRKDRILSTVLQKPLGRGIGANMAVRRDVVLRMGGFDEACCPGGKFHACVDGDLTIRALLSGHQVYEIAKSKVLHYGFRNWEQGRALTRNAWTGIGAAFVKPLKCGRWDALPVLLCEFIVHALLPFLWATITFRHSKGWLRVQYFLNGFFEGWRTPIDKQNVTYLCGTQQESKD